MKRLVLIAAILAALWLPRAQAQLPLLEAVLPCLQPDRSDCPISVLLPLPAASLPLPAITLPVLPVTPAVPSAPAVKLPLVELPNLPLPSLFNLPIITPAQQVLRELLQDPFQSALPVLGTTGPLLGVNPCNDPLACLDSPIAQQAFAAVCEFARAPEIYLDFGTLASTGPQAQQPRATSGVLVRCGPGVRYRFRLVQGTSELGDGTLTVRVGRKESRVRIESDGQPVQSAVFIGNGETQQHTIDAVLLAESMPTRLVSGRMQGPSDLRLMLDW